MTEYESREVFNNSPYCYEKMVILADLTCRKSSYILIPLHWN